MAEVASEGEGDVCAKSHVITCLGMIDLKVRYIAACYLFIDGAQ